MHQADTMDDFHPLTRLRNACDACHKLKRRCTGAMPCENCASLGSSCFYSVAGRLGRPRGSRSRRNVERLKTPPTQAPTQKATPALVPNGDAAASAAFNNMLYLNFDSFDPAAPYKLSMNMGQSPDATMNLFSSAEADALPNLDHASAFDRLMNSIHSPDAAMNLFAADADALPILDHSSTFDSSSPSQPTTGNNTPPSISSMQVQFEQQQQLQQERPVRQQTAESQHRSLFSHQPQLNPSHQPSPSSTGSPAPSCQCISGLSALLHDLRRPSDDKPPMVGLDSVLSRVSDALARWSVFAACPRCQHHESDDDDGETLLLAALSIRKVVAQLRAVGAKPGERDEEAGPQLYVGAFQVTGPDHTMLLGVLRTITLRKLDATVTTMQSMLRTKRARRGEADTAILDHIEAMLDELAKSI